MKDTSPKKRILIGIGNSGRSDDGLGWSFVEAIEQAGNYDGDIIQRYQLQVEDAELISHYDQVIFVDACHEQLPDGFEMRPCIAAKNFSFTTHSLAPETVLFLCKDLYNKKPHASLVLIEGESWELQIGLSSLASKNLEKALESFNQNFLLTRV